MNHMETILIFTGYNNRAIITFLRTLKKNDICKYKIVALGEDDCIFKTIYKYKVCYVRKDASLNFAVFKNIIEAIKTEKDERFWIVPSSEYFNRFLLEQCKELLDIGCNIPLVNKELYNSISDKASFKKMCFKQGFDVPKDIYKLDAFEQCVAKTHTYFADDGKNYSPILIKNEKDYQMFKECYNESLFYYEQYVVGESYYLLYYFSKNGKVYKFSQKNLVQQPEGKSIVVAKSSDLHKKDIGVKFEKLFLELGFFGLVMVELRKCDDKYYMIEANPRLWGPSQLFYDSKCNFFEAMLCENGFIDDDVVFEEKDSLYYWNGGVQQIKAKGGELAYLAVEEKDIMKIQEELISCEIYNRVDTKELYLEGK